MITSQQKMKFAKTMVGIFSNEEQAQKNPKDFPHVNIYCRAIDWKILNGPGLYSEQSYNYDPWSPYRQTIHRLTDKNGKLYIENYKLDCPERVAGSGLKKELILGISNQVLRKKVGCGMYFVETQEYNYQGEIEKGNACIINRMNKITYLKSFVELNRNYWKSYDIGLEVNTNKKVWGTEYGPIICKKITSLDSEIDERWLNGR